MSRGHGSAQRAILHILGRAAPGWLAVTEMADRLYHAVPTRSQVETVRRAVKRLEAEDLALTMLRGGQLCARALTAQEQEAMAASRQRLARFRGGSGPAGSGPAGAGPGPSGGPAPSARGSLATVRAPS